MMMMMMMMMKIMLGLLMMMYWHPIKSIQLQFLVSRRQNSLIKCLVPPICGAFNKAFLKISFHFLTWVEVVYLNKHCVSCKCVCTLAKSLAPYWAMNVQYNTGNESPPPIICDVVVQMFRCVCWHKQIHSVGFVWNTVDELSHSWNGEMLWLRDFASHVPSRFKRKKGNGHFVTTHHLRKEISSLLKQSTDEQFSLISADPCHRNYHKKLHRKRLVSSGAKEDSLLNAHLR